MSTILIIEDEKGIVDLISFNLKREGYEIMEAYDGKTGLDIALSGKADLVLLDVMLPVMDGFEVLRRIRERSALPVIMVTALFGQGAGREGQGQYPPHDRLQGVGSRGQLWAVHR